MLATQAFMSQTPDFNEARAALYAMGIKTTYTDDLVLFSVIHIHRKVIQNEMQSECNGLILSRQNWRPVVVPPRTLQFTIDTQATNKQLNKYALYAAKNGTSFNLYYNQVWHMSTVNGLDMADVPFNDRTLRGYISEICPRWAEFCDALDKSACYSFGFSHPACHPTCDAPAVWFIQRVTVDPENPDYLLARRGSFDTLDIIQCPTQETIEPVDKLETLYKKSASAEEDYYRDNTKCYGFILRSSSLDVGRNTDLYIESRFMKKIRQYWYDSSATQMCITRRISKTTVIPLMNYLSKRSTEFIRLFSQTAHQMQQYEAFTNQLCDAIRDPTPDTPIRQIANQLAVKFALSKASKVYDNSDQHTKQIILRDFLISPDNFEIYLQHALGF
jgi:hypothetical protein